MARRLQTSDADNNDLNLTPLIDAVFLLLVFFMVTSVFIQATQLKIELPVAENYDQIDQEKKLNLLISAEGQLEFNSQLVSMGQLATLIENERRRIHRLRTDLFSMLWRSLSRRVSAKSIWKLAKIKPPERQNAP
jgi:biopolymer transport protein ExbD